MTEGGSRPVPSGGLLLMTGPSLVTVRAGKWFVVPFPSFGAGPPGFYTHGPWAVSLWCLLLSSLRSGRSVSSGVGRPFWVTQSGP